MKKMAYLLLVSLTLGIWGSFPALGLADPRVNGSTCPRDLRSLTSLLLRDLPSYANRVSQRSHHLISGSTTSYLIVAGNPDFTPITTDINSSSNFSQVNPQGNLQNNSQRDGELQQVFFTTLHREYQGRRMVETQEFHRLFLVQTSQGWQLTLMYSRIGLPNQQLTPPQESLNSAIGQAVSIWLRDCQAGTIRN